MVDEADADTACELRLPEELTLAEADIEPEDSPYLLLDVVAVVVVVVVYHTVGVLVSGTNEA